SRTTRTGALNPFATSTPETWGSGGGAGVEGARRQPHAEAQRASETQRNFCHRGTEPQSTRASQSMGVAWRLARPESNHCANDSQVDRRSCSGSIRSRESARPAGRSIDWSATTLSVLGVSRIRELFSVSRCLCGQLSLRGLGVLIYSVSP